jgi:hypothetical protein
MKTINIVVPILRKHEMEVSGCHHVCHMGKTSGTGTHRARDSID